MDELNYVIFNVSELDLIDFDQVRETSRDTLRYSVDLEWTFVKWIGSMPASVAALTTKGAVLTNEEILIVLSGPDWTLPLPT